MVNVEVQFVASVQDTPEENEFRSWANAVESTVAGQQEAAIRIVDEAEMAELNFQYRKKNGPTNVLSFPAQLHEEIDIPFIGDVIICASIVAKEALEQGKSLESHWAHMTVHGILHLQGYDHIDDGDANKMENLEIQIMNKLGFENPYV